MATPGEWWLARMFESLEPWPVNYLMLGRGNTVSHEAMWEQLRGGAGRFKFHEDWGATPAVVDAALTVAEESGVQVAIHSDTLNEAGFVEDLLRVVDRRTFHSFHTEGAGGGTPRTSSGSRASPTCCPPRLTPPAPLRSIRWRNTSTW